MAEETNNPQFSTANIEVVLDKGEPTERRINVEIPEEGRQRIHVLALIPSPAGEFQLPIFAPLDEITSK